MIIPVPSSRLAKLRGSPDWWALQGPLKHAQGVKVIDNDDFFVNQEYQRMYGFGPSFKLGALTISWLSEGGS